MSKAVPSLDDFAPQMRQRGPRCTYSTLMARLTPAQRANVELAHERGLPTSAISRTIRIKYGQEISAWVLGRHWRGDCTCGR